MLLKTLTRIVETSKILGLRNVHVGRILNAAPTTDTTEQQLTKKSISKSMKAYLERAREHNEFMAEKNLEFQIGKRHLANMMGEDPETFTQEDIDNAIEYLFPSGLYDKKARPVLRPPEEIYPQRKAAEFDEAGRPHHFLFYTGRPNFYKLLYDIVEHMQELNKFEDSMILKNLKPDPNLKLEMAGYQWTQKSDLEKQLVEVISDKEYGNFINTMERLCSLPYAIRAKDFIFKYRSPLLSPTTTLEIPKPQYDTDGRAYITTYECLRKDAKGDVTVRMPGSGRVTINGKGIEYFDDTQSREQIRSRIEGPQKKTGKNCASDGGGR